MVKVVQIHNKNGWIILVEGVSHGSLKNEIDAKRAAVNKINSLITELKQNREKLTDEILKAT